MVRQTIFLIENLCAAFTLWLGLYVVTRDLPWQEGLLRPRRRPALLAGSGLVLIALYLYGIAMETVSPTAEDYVRWLRATWWGPLIAVFFFYRAVARLVQPHPGPMLWRRLLYPLVILCALLLVAGIVTGYVFDHDGIEPRASLFQPFYVPTHSVYGVLFFVYVTVGLAITFLFLLAQARRAQRAGAPYKGLRLLALGVLLGWIGAEVNFVLAPHAWPWLPKQIGDYLATAGAAIIAVGVARYNALNDEQLLEQDFWHSLSSVAVTVSVFWMAYYALSWLFGYPTHPMAIVLLSVIGVVTQTPYNWEEAITDRLLLPRWAVGYRDRLILMRRELLTAPDPSRVLAQAEETFGALVRSVRMDQLEELIMGELESIFQYAHFDNPDVLAKSRLHELHTVQEAQRRYARRFAADPTTLSPQQQAACLRAFLEEAIQDGFPVANNGKHASVASRDIGQVILCKKYVDGWTRPAVERYLHDQYGVTVTGGAYSRHLREARMQLGRVLFDRELTRHSFAD